MRSDLDNCPAHIFSAGPTKKNVFLLYSLSMSVEDNFKPNLASACVAGVPVCPRFPLLCTVNLIVNIVTIIIIIYYSYIIINFSLALTEMHSVDYACNTL